MDCYHQKHYSGLLPLEKLSLIATTRRNIILDCYHRENYPGFLPPETLFWVVTWNDVGVEERHDEDDAQASGQHDVQHAQNQPRNKQTSQLKIYMNFIISSTNMQS